MRLQVVALLGILPCILCSAISSPAFLWGTSQLVAGTDEGSSSRTVSEAVPGKTLLGGILRALVSGQAEGAAGQYVRPQEAGAAQAQTTLVFVSQQMAAQRQTLTQLAGQLQPVRDSLGQAASALIIPHVTYQGTSSLGAAARASLAKLPGSSPAVTELGACGGAPGGSSSSPATLEAFTAALAPAGQQQVLLVCPQGASLDAELALLHSLEGALAAAAGQPPRSYAVLLLAQPSAAAAAESRRRALLEGAPLAGSGGHFGKQRSKYVCDAKCETQVKLLEGLILALNVLAAIGVGSWMLHILGTPTRWETPKDQGNTRD